MKLPLLLLALAALLSWATLQLQALGGSEHNVVVATRSLQPANGETPTSQPTGAVPPAPPLFRAATSASTTPELGERLSLIGLAGGPEARVAFLRDEADGRTFTLRVGEEIRSWRLEQASERCVVLRRARRRENACLS